MSAEQFIEDLVAEAFGKMLHPISEPWPLWIERIATSSIHRCGKRIPRRIRQSGNALSKLIRSDAAAGFWSGEANGQ